ncbi:MAG: hypothetical protein ACOVOG_10140, partial [Rubrivivax sp.]
MAKRLSLPTLTAAKWRLPMAPVALACALIAGCGGASDPGASTSSGPAADAPGPVATGPAPGPGTGDVTAVGAPPSDGTLNPGEVGSGGEILDLDLADPLAADSNGMLIAQSAAPTTWASFWFEAEKGRLGGGARVMDVSNASGKKSVGWFHVQGAFVELQVRSSRASAFDLNLRYANGNESARNLSVYVNGVRAAQLSLANTGGWDKFNEGAVARLKLPVG